MLGAPSCPPPPTIVMPIVKQEAEVVQEGTLRVERIKGPAIDGRQVQVYRLLLDGRALFISEDAVRLAGQAFTEQRIDVARKYVTRTLLEKSAADVVALGKPFVDMMEFCRKEYGGCLARLELSIKVKTRQCVTATGLVRVVRHVQKSKSRSAKHAAVGQGGQPGQPEQQAQVQAQPAAASLEAAVDDEALMTWLLGAQPLQFEAWDHATAYKE